MRSDTVTKPTDEMRKAAAEAIVGDDVFGDDPTVIELEEYAADLLGMEKALYVSSGTQGNLISILAQTNTGDEVLLEEQSHIYLYEAGGMSALGGTIPKTYKSDRGYISPENIRSLIREDNVHFAKSSLFCIENTHNKHGGAVLSPDQIKEMASTAREFDLKVHLDGARIFNACTALNVDIKEYTQHVDSIQLCLSKGLSAPIGSLVAGSKEFIYIARRKRKMLGGGMRQVGIIAAPGLIALRHMRDRLKFDHENAKYLEQGLIQHGLEVFPVETNILVCNVSRYFENATQAVSSLKEHGILISPFGNTLVRFTTHREIEREDIERTISVIQENWK